MAIVIAVWMYCSFRLVCRYRQIEEKSRAANVFMASLSHELRTPLSGISGAVQLLQDTGLDKRQREYARMISYANTTLLEVLDDMLNYSRIESGKYEAQIVPFSLHEVIDDMLSLQTIQAQKRGIALIRDIDRRVPDVIVGDRRKLNQVLLNIIGNAIKFTDEGSVTISVRAYPPTVDGVTLHFSIVDTGIGMPAAQCVDVFKPFVQANLEHGRRGGTGLGLAICQRLINGMGGDIRLDSKLNEGSCVQFHLPFGIAPDMPAEALRTATEPAPGRSRPLTVLLVEDDEINRLVCTRYLALNGHHPLVAGDGRQVLHILQSKEQSVDAILTDLNLPGISGIDLSMQIREMEGGRWKHVPVIIMSADVVGDVMERSLVAGMSAFLQKPFTSAQLNHTLETVMAGRDNVTVLPVDVKTASPGSVEPGSMLDTAWIENEIQELGADMVLELLNIFRAGVASDLGAIDAAIMRGDWSGVAADAHRLRSAAGNLGMKCVIDAAHQLEAASNASIVHRADAERLASQLIGLCHASCDELRSRLLAARQRVAFAADGDD